jgi:hypothetical protein
MAVPERGRAPRHRVSADSGRWLEAASTLYKAALPTHAPDSASGSPSHVAWIGYGRVPAHDDSLAPPVQVWNRDAAPSP